MEFKESWESRLRQSTESFLPLVSVVLLNWNGERHIHRCIDHLLAQTYQSIEMILVDNGSSDGSLQRIKARFPDFTYIENGENLGYAAGMNRGIEVSRGAFVILLNQDACLDTQFVSQCIEKIMQDDMLGAIGGRVLCWLKDRLTSTLRKGEGEHSVVRKRFQGDGGNVSDRPMLTFAAAGCFPFLRREMLEDLRNTSGYYYDEAYVTGWEDFDLYFRMHLRGWKCLFVPTAVGWHVGSGSVGGNATFFSKSTEYQVRILRNRYFTIIKDVPLILLLRLSPYLALTEAALPFYFIIRSPRSLSALVSAWYHVLRASPSLMRKRLLIQRSRTVDGMYLRRYFVRL